MRNIGRVLNGTPVRWLIFLISVKRSTTGSVQSLGVTIQLVEKTFLEAGHPRGGFKVGGWQGIVLWASGTMQPNRTEDQHNFQTLGVHRCFFPRQLRCPFRPQGLHHRALAWGYR